jgi:hypothetical protein
VQLDRRVTNIGDRSGVAQPAWGFRDESGRYSYEFNRVYGPARRARNGVEGQRLDEGSSYWVMSWLEGVCTHLDHRRERSLTFTQARRLGGTRLTFARFSTLAVMRADLSALLRGSRDPRTVMVATMPAGTSLRPLGEVAPRPTPARRGRSPA